MSDKLRPNPFSQVTIRHLAGEPSELRVWSVTKRRRATTRNFSAGARPNFERICAIATQTRAPGSTKPAPSIEDYVVLTSLGLWAPETDLIDPIFFEAPVRSHPAVRAEPWPVDGFSLCGEVWLQSGDEPSDALQGIPLGCLSRARPILWHRGADIEPALPWWPDEPCLAAIEAVLRDAPRYPSLLPALQALSEQGILVRRTAESPGSDGRATRQSSRASFARDGFVNLGQMLPAGQIAALQTYWQKLAALDVFPQRGDKRQGSHGEPSSMLLLYLLKPSIEYLVGRPIEPAFSYSWIYGRGTEMPRHRDRAESRYTVTFLADYAPEMEGPTPWPLFIWPRGQNSPVDIRQSVGDALLFCGEDLRHSRPPFTMGDRSTSLLLHYVDRGFSGKLF
jgi:hypothetical protein